MPKAGGEVPLRYRAGAVQLSAAEAYDDHMVSMRGIARVRCNPPASTPTVGWPFQCAVSRGCGATELLRSSRPKNGPLLAI
jgi:hypothetical protein